MTAAFGATPGGKADAARPVQCPCGGGAWERCCARFIDGGQTPDSAETLMRSRYSAYVLRDACWLRASWDPATCPADFGFDETPAPRWLGLDIRRHEILDARHALVEFVARYKIGARAFRLHERSRFVRGDDGRWRYVDGDIDPA
jgi:SEC-C motif-containing protein